MSRPTCNLSWSLIRLFQTMDQYSQDRWKSPLGLIYWIFQNLQAPYLEMLKDALRIFSFSQKTESTLHSLGWIQKPLVWRLAMLQLASNQWWWSGYSKSPFGPVNHNQFKIKALLVSIRFLTVCTAGCTSQNMSRCGEISEKRVNGNADIRNSDSPNIHDKNQSHISITSHLAHRSSATWAISTYSRGKTL